MMQRRHVLQVGASSLAGAGLVDFGRAATGKPGLGLRVLVLGSGLAGLAAARALVDAGFAVTTLEARKRLGGRIWTSESWPYPLDLGATWIHGVRGNPLSRLADSAGVQRLGTSYSSTRIYSDQGREYQVHDHHRLERLEQTLFKALRSAQRSDPDRSVFQVVKPLIDRMPQARERLEARFLLNARIEQEYAGDIERLSSHWYDAADEFGGGDVLFPKGFGVLLPYLVGDLDVRLNSEVLAVRQDERGVHMDCRDGTRHSAHFAVVTVPLGVLKVGRPHFDPGLPAAMRQAVDRLEMGVLNKCYLRFERVFWPDDVDWLEVVSRQPGRWSQWVSMARVAGWPVLLGFHAGSAARDLERRSDQETVILAMEALRAVLGQHIPDPLGYQITRWASDPLALGSYSMYPLGSGPRDREALLQPIGKRVLLAGEATSLQYFGTAQGAYSSGLDAARRIMTMAVGQ